MNENELLKVAEKHSDDFFKVINSAEVLRNFSNLMSRNTDEAKIAMYAGIEDILERIVHYMLQASEHYENLIIALGKKQEAEDMRKLTEAA